MFRYQLKNNENVFIYLNVQATESLSEEKLAEYKDIFSFFDRFAFYQNEGGGGDDRKWMQKKFLSFFLIWLWSNMFCLISKTLFIRTIRSLEKYSWISHSVNQFLTNVNIFLIIRQTKISFFIIIVFIFTIILTSSMFYIQLQERIFLKQTRKVSFSFRIATSNFMLKSCKVR